MICTIWYYFNPTTSEGSKRMLFGMSVLRRPPRFVDRRGSITHISFDCDPTFPVAGLQKPFRRRLHYSL